MIGGIILTIAGLGALCVLLYNFAVYALPAYVGLSVGYWAISTGAGTVGGIAVGIGTTMLLHCDLVYVADDARFSTPFVDLALVPEAASSLLLPARIGHVRAFALFALGETLDGAGALAGGLANAVLPADQVTGRARAAAQLLAAKPALALQATKKLMRDQERILAVIEAEGREFALRLKSSEAQAMFQAFMSRRGS